MTRRPELDALRGLMLIMITATHLPTRWAEWLSQPFGFVSAAEGFVFLSAYFVGLIYWRIGEERGARAMAAALWDRAALVWAWHVAMLIFLFTIVAYAGLAADRPAVKDMIGFYLREPLLGLAAGMALLYNPPLLDILPMYVMFMLLTPLALLLGRRPDGWLLVVVVSVTVWFLQQFGLGERLYLEVTRLLSFKVPLHENGAFDVTAWQLLWVIGLWMGVQGAEGRTPGRFPGWMVALAVVLALGGMLWRHAVGQAPFGADVYRNLVFDKWQLGPLRLLSFFALLVVAMRFGPWLAARVRLRGLELLGRASLPVFCGHLVLVLVTLAVFGDLRGHPLSFQTLLLVLSVAVLFYVAIVAEKVSAPRKRRKHAAGSPSATGHSPGRSGEGRPSGTAPSAGARPRPASA